MFFPSLQSLPARCSSSAPAISWLFYDPMHKLLRKRKLGTRKFRALLFREAVIKDKLSAQERSYDSLSNVALSHAAFDFILGNRTIRGSDWP